LTDASTRPDDLKGMIFTEQHLAKILEAYLGDGASVDGLTTIKPGSRQLLETPREAVNVFWYLDEFRKRLRSTPLIGVWCSPLRVDLVADKITDLPDTLPTFAAFKQFLDGVPGELKHSNLSTLDLEYLNVLLTDEPVKVSSLTCSGKEWFSNLDALVEVVEYGFSRVWLRAKQRMPFSSGKTLEKLRWQLAFLENPLTHLVLPAYLDMQKKLRRMNRALLQKDNTDLDKVCESVNEWTEWVEEYALQPQSVVVKVLTEWCSKTVKEDGLAASRTYLESSLATLRRVVNKTGKGKFTNSEGRSTPEMLQRVTVLKDGRECTMTITFKKKDVETAAREIKEACRSALASFKHRFPKHEVLDALKALFSPKAEPVKMNVDCKRRLLQTVASHWGGDLSELEDAYDCYVSHLGQGVTFLFRAVPFQNIISSAKVRSVPFLK
jgi:hypothetical protein